MRTRDPRCAGYGVTDTPKRGGARKGAGRPALAERRTHQVKVLLTERQRAELDAIAEAEGVTPAEYVADLVEDAIARRVR